MVARNCCTWHGLEDQRAPGLFAYSAQVVARMKCNGIRGVRTRQRNVSLQAKPRIALHFIRATRWSLIAHPCASIDRPHPCGLTACFRVYRSPLLRGPGTSERIVRADTTARSLRPSRHLAQAHARPVPHEHKFLNSSDY